MEVHFSISGGFVTQTARDLMLSEDPGAAWRLIATGLRGDGIEAAARAVLDGTKRLDGENELELVDERDASAYLRDLRYIYAGRIRWQGTWRRPVAVIANYGEGSGRWATAGMKGEDLRDADDVLRPVKRWLDRRAQFFCGEGEIAVLIDRQYVVFETCGETPFWWDPLNTPQEALANAQEAGRWLNRLGDGVGDYEVYEAVMDDPDVSAEEAKDVEDDMRVAQETVRRLRRENLMVDIAARVREQAGDDTFVLHVEGRGEIVVPRAPFVCWALGRTSLKYLAPPWEAVSPSGMKLQLDDPCHTDWMLGAGLNLSEDYGFGSAVGRAAEDERFRLQRELGSFEATVLVDAGWVSGKVGETVLVLPNLSPAYAEQAMAPGVRAIITERGGRLAHLSVIGRERGWTIMLVSDAVTRYPEGVAVALDPGSGTIDIL